MNTNSDKPAWLSIKDAADYLGVGEPTIYRWMRERKMTYRKIGDSTRFLKEDLDAVVEVHPSEKDADIVQLHCPLCHHDELVQGSLQSTGMVYFRPRHRETRFWTFEDANIHADARMCTRCGHVALFGDLSKLKRLHPEGKAS